MGSGLKRLEPGAPLWIRWPEGDEFRSLGFVDFDKGGGLTVHSGLLSVVLHDSVSMSNQP